MSRASERMASAGARRPAARAAGRPAKASTSFLNAEGLPDHRYSVARANRLGDRLVDAATFGRREAEVRVRGVEIEPAVGRASAAELIEDDGCGGRREAKSRIPALQHQADERVDSVDMPVRVSQSAPRTGSLTTYLKQRSGSG
jgi:hypothetical protein